MKRRKMMRMTLTIPAEFLNYCLLVHICFVSFCNFSNVFQVECDVSFHLFFLRIIINVVSKNK